MGWNRQQYPPEDEPECPVCQSDDCDCAEAAAEDAAVSRAEEARDHEEWLQDQGYYDE